jgi:hypothetical protein
VRLHAVGSPPGWTSHGGALNPEVLAPPGPEACSPFTYSSPTFVAPYSVLSFPIWNGNPGSTDPKGTQPQPIVAIRSLKIDRQP